MAWFRRTQKGIQTATEDKKDVPKGLWYKSPTGKIVDAEQLEKNFYVSPEDGYHVRIGSNEYFKILFDDNKFTELDKNLSSRDPLEFEDTFHDLVDGSLALLQRLDEPGGRIVHAEDLADAQAIVQDVVKCVGRQVDQRWL